MTMDYEALDYITRDEFWKSYGGPAEEAGVALLRLALYEEETSWAEQQCFVALQDTRLEVRFAAATGLGHVARRQKGLQSATIARLVSLRHDKELGGRVEDALDDLATFARQNP